MKYTSKNLKAALLNYLTFQRQMIAGTEVAIGNCGVDDVVAYDYKNKFSYAIEVKISKSDLKNELKKYKNKMIGQSFIRKVNYFYFCIPGYLYTTCSHHRM